MLALRRASNPLKYRGISPGSFRASCARVEVASCYFKNDAESAKHAELLSDPFVSFKRFQHKQAEPLEFYVGRHHLSSRAGMKSSEDEDDLENGFSELETSASAGETHANSISLESDGESDDDLLSESALSDKGSDDEVAGHENELGLSDIEAEVSKSKVDPNRTSMQMLNAVIDSPGNSVKMVLDKWVKDGNEVKKSDMALLNLNLRKRKMYGRALQALEWSADRFEFSERDYASRLDLIAKVRGLHKAEEFVAKIPKAYRGEVVYRTYLANCVANQNVRKAEEVFNKMKKLGLEMTAFSYNQLILLYKRTDKKKLADLVLQMKKENVKPSVFTYNLLIDTRGQLRDINGMNKLAEDMKAEGLEPTNQTRSTMAKHYIHAGLSDNAEAVMKEMEEDGVRENHAARNLLELYALLGKADEVSRVWKLCESNATIYESQAAIKALGILHKIKEAEEVFEKTILKWKRPSPQIYTTLLNVYSRHKMLTEGKGLVKQMADSGCRIGPVVWDALVRLHVDAGEVEKAHAILHKATQQYRTQPLFSSYIAIMEQYSKKGDVHNSEKIFHQMRQAGYVARLRQFQVLVQTYVNSKTPAYGMNQRMVADNIYPTPQLYKMLAQIDPFKKTAASDLLD